VNSPSDRSLVSERLDARQQDWTSDKDGCVRSAIAGRDSEVASFFHFDTLLGPIGLEDHVDSLNDFFALIGLTIEDEFVLKGFGSVNLHHMLLAKTVVPTTIPGGQIISVLLKRVGQLGAG
jgi:hypothetical protein